MLAMPPVDHQVVARRAAIARALRAIVPDGVIDDPDALRVYESDGLTAYRQPPMVVVLPETVLSEALVLAERLRQAVEAKVQVPLKCAQLRHQKWRNCRPG